MPLLSSYTAFESLLFFQSLATLDARPASFASISEWLRNNKFIKQDATFDTNRLSPQALEELYSELLKGGLEGWDAISAEQSQNGPNSESPDSNPKKRKIPVPLTEQIGDRAWHSTVVTGLVSRLYTRYKERATREIEDEETRYKDIREEIERLENGEYSQPTPTPVEDQDVQSTEIDKVSQVESASVNQATGVDGDGYRKEIDDENKTSTLLHETEPPTALVEALVEKFLNADEEKDQDIAQQALQSDSADLTTQIPSGSQTQAIEDVSSQQCQDRDQDQASNLQGAPYMPHGEVTEPTVINEAVPPASPHALHPYPSASPKGSPEKQVTQQQQPVTLGSSSGANSDDGPDTGPLPIPPSPMASSSIKALMQSMTSLAETGNQHRQPQAMAVSPITPQFPSPELSTPIPLPGGNIRPPQSPQQSPQTPHTHASPYPNVTVPGRSLPPRATPPRHSTPHRSLQSPHAQPAGSMSPSATNVGPLDPMTEGIAFTAEPPRLAVQTPLSGTFGRRPPRPSLDTSVARTTPWKMDGPTPKSPRSPTRPCPEDVSPISERAHSPAEFPDMSSAKSEIRTAGSAPGSSKAKIGEKKSKHPELDSLPPTGTRSKKATPALRGRGARSPVSSPVAVPTRNRSRGLSIASRDDESITDSASGTHRRIKHELSATPAGILEDADVEVRLSTRRKHIVPAQTEESGLPRAGMKRRRGPSDVVVAEDGQQSSSRHASQYVYCTRNFSRTCATIMNDVAAHKHASIFAKPLTDRDAPGYKDLIYRPQDIKSIKSAIHQGTKAVVAAVEAANTPSADVESPGLGTPSKNNGLMLKRTVDLLPPKGIINSPQLEKELTRMFANAVMFNPTPESTFGPWFAMQSDVVSREGTQVPESDEGGIINDTLEMCDEVEKAVSRWREAERAVDDMGPKPLLSLRRGSASDINMDSADDVT